MPTSVVRKERLTITRDVRLADIVGETVVLTRERHSHRGRCPRHPDPTAGLHVAASGIFYCFSCGWGGDALDWLSVTRAIGIDEAMDVLRGRSITQP